MAQLRPFAPRDLLAARLITELSAGPAGRVALAVRELDTEAHSYRTHIWAAAPGEEPVQLTRGEKSCTTPRYSPSGKWVAFLSNRPDGKPGEEGPQTQVWLLPTGGGEAFCLTKAPLGVRSYMWAPDGQSIFFLAEEPDLPATKARKSAAKKRKDDAIVERGERRRKQIWRIDAKGGAEAALVFDGCFGLQTFALSPQADRVAYATNYTGFWEDGHMDLWVLEVASGETRQVTRGTYYISSPAFSPSGETLAFVTPRDPKKSYSRSELFQVPAGGGEMINLSDRSPGYHADMNMVTWESEERLLVLGGEGAYGHVARIHAETGTVERLSDGEQVVTSFSLSTDRSAVAYVTESAHRLPDILLQPLDGPRHTVLTDLNPSLRDSFTWGEQRVIQWQAPDGLTIEGVLTLPVGYREGDRPPLLVQVHGGPHGRSINMLRGYFSPQVLAGKGYAVLQPNYRGSAGYGHEFAVSNFRDLGGGDYRDIMAGVDYVVDQGWADPERLGILGGSYGGYMTNWAIGQTDRFKAAVSLFGIFSLITDYSQSDLPTWENAYLDAYWWEDPEIYQRCAPATHLLKMKTPVLIIHGDADNNTRPANSREMYQALRHLGRTVQYVRYPREGHGVLEPSHKLDEYARVLGWFEEHLLGGPILARHEAERDGHRLSVGAPTVAASYSGCEAKGRYVALPVSLAPGEGKLKLDLGQVRLLAEVNHLTWESGVAGVAVGELLLPVSGVVETDRAAQLTLVFDLANKAPGGEYRLLSESFPPLLVEVPVE